MLKMLNFNYRALFLISFCVKALFNYSMYQHLLVTLTKKSHEITQIRKHVRPHLICVSHEMVGYFKHERLKLLRVSKIFT